MKCQFASELLLKQYQNALADQRLLEERIDHLDAYAKSATRRITGMPRSGGGGDCIPSLIDERKHLLSKIERIQRLKQEILSLIELLPDDEKRLLTAIFILGLSVEKAAAFVPCSERTAYDLKKRALHKLDLELKKEPTA